MRGTGYRYRFSMGSLLWICHSCKELFLGSGKQRLPELPNERSCRWFIHDKFRHQLASQRGVEPIHFRKTGDDANPMFLTEHVEVWTTSPLVDRDVVMNSHPPGKKQWQYLR